MRDEPNRESLWDIAGDANKSDGGLVCQQCGCRHFRTYNTFQSPNGYVRRRKICRHCGTFISTVEKEVGKGKRDL